MFFTWWLDGLFYVSFWCNRHGWLGVTYDKLCRDALYCHSHITFDPSANSVDVSICVVVFAGSIATRVNCSASSLSAPSCLSYPPPPFVSLCATSRYLIVFISAGTLSRLQSAAFSPFLVCHLLIVSLGQAKRCHWTNSLCDELSALVSCAPHCRDFFVFVFAWLWWGRGGDLSIGRLCWLDLSAAVCARLLESVAEHAFLSLSVCLSVCLCPSNDIGRGIKTSSQVKKRNSKSKNKPTTTKTECKPSACHAPFISFLIETNCLFWP